MPDLKPSYDYLRPVLNADWPTIPLNKPDAMRTVRGQQVAVGKAPMHANWPKLKKQTVREAHANITDGHNTGIPLGRRINSRRQYLCAYDIDLGNLPNGTKDIPPLVNHIASDLEVSLHDLVIHQSGNDGLHVFFLSSQPDLKGHVDIDGIKVEVKSKGQQVVAPGSIHPDTRSLYMVHPDSASHHKVPVAPKHLVEQLSKRREIHRSPQVIPPSRLQWIAEQLAEAIHQDGSEILVTYEDWLRGGMAFHAASGGDWYGLDAWIQCSDAGESDLCQYKWETFGEGQVTEKTLNHFLAEAGIDTTKAPGLTAEEVAEYIADDFADLEPDEVAPVKSKSRLLSLDDLLNLPEPEWLVDHAIVKNSLVVLYGPPKSAKTFLAIDIALSIATGQPAVHGFNCKTGKTLYILAEGGRNMMGNRVRAWMDNKGQPNGEHFAVLDEGVLLSSRKSVDNMLDIAGDDWDLIVVDTLARCMEGDENSVKDMGQAIRGCDYIRRKTNAAILLVHHSGKDQSKGLRGSTALLGAVDGTIKMREKSDNYEMSIPELRHGEPPPAKLLSLQSMGGSAVLIEGHESVSPNIRGQVLESLSQLDDKTPRVEATEHLVDDMGVVIRSARRYITKFLGQGKENATEWENSLMWLEQNPQGASKNVQIVRVVDKA